MEQMKKQMIEQLKDKEKLQMPITTLKKIWKCFILYDSNYITFGKRQHYGHSDQGLKGMKRCIGGAQGTFRNVRLLCTML
jgi:hypothetical protein